MEEERKWAEALRNAATGGFDVIYRGFRHQVLGYVQSRLPDREAAEELTQEIFIKVFRFRESYRPEFPFKSWFWTLVRNSITDWKRRGEINTVSPEEHSPEEMHTEEPDAESLLHQKHLRRAFIKRLKSLTRLQRKVLWFRLIHGLSYQEIARKLGLSLASVKCLSTRARAALNVMGERETGMVFA